MHERKTVLKSLQGSKHSGATTSQLLVCAHGKTFKPFKWHVMVTARGPALASLAARAVRGASGRVSRGCVVPPLLFRSRPLPVALQTASYAHARASNFSSRRQGLSSAKLPPLRRMLVFPTAAPGDLSNQQSDL